MTDANGALIASYVFAGETPVAKSTASGTEYYLTDAMGSVIGTASESGALVEALDYDAFGNERGEEAVASDAHGDFRLHGMWKDPSGIYYVRARVYDAETGRFTSRDPYRGFFEASESLQPYAFAASSPHIARDPLGLYFVVDTMAALQARYFQVTTSIASFGGFIARTQANARGHIFERLVRTAIQAGRHVRVAGQGLNGQLRTVIPDAVWRGVTEIKDVAYLTNSNQIQAMISYARQSGQTFNLVVGPATKEISQNLIDQVVLSGGNVYYFNVVSLTLQIVH